MFVARVASTYVEFTRALDSRQLPRAVAAARDLPQLSLDDALALCLLYAEQAPGRYAAAAARWHGRLALEAGLDLLESQLALGALMLLPGPSGERGTKILAEIGRRHRVPLARSLGG